MVERQIDTELFMNQNSGLQSDLINSDPDGDAALSPLLASISATPATASIAAAATQQLAVQGTQWDGVTRTVTKECKYSSADEAVATVDGAGLVTGVAAGGPVNITARYGDLTDTCAITVT